MLNITFELDGIYYKDIVEGKVIWKINDKSWESHKLFLDWHIFSLMKSIEETILKKKEYNVDTTDASFTRVYVKSDSGNVIVDIKYSPPENAGYDEPIAINETVSRKEFVDEVLRISQNFIAALEGLDLDKVKINAEHDVDVKRYMKERTEQLKRQFAETKELAGNIFLE